MNARLAIAALTLLGSPWSGAQNVAQEPQEDPVQKAIREFNRRDSEKPNEITVRLDDRHHPRPRADPEPAAAPEAPKPEPILVTGKPPEGTQLTEPEPNPDHAAATPHRRFATHGSRRSPRPQTPRPRRARRKTPGRHRHHRSLQVKLLAPFPAKPLAQAPAGWRLESSEHAPPFTREVELSPGKKITLKIRPHLFVPEADGAAVFNISEPGFEPRSATARTPPSAPSSPTPSASSTTTPRNSAPQSTNSNNCSSPCPNRNPNPRPNRHPNPKLQPRKR